MGKSAAIVLIFALVFTSFIGTAGAAGHSGGSHSGGSHGGAHGGSHGGGSHGVVHGGLAPFHASGSVHSGAGALRNKLYNCDESVGYYPQDLSCVRPQVSPATVPPLPPG